MGDKKVGIRLDDGNPFLNVGFRIYVRLLSPTLHCTAAGVGEDWADVNGLGKGSKK